VPEEPHDAEFDPAEGRDESPLERLDRNTVELLNELRVAGTGIQVLLAFLLVVPFNNRFTRLSTFARTDYYVTLTCVAVAAVLLIAPSIHHRLLFRRAQKAFVVRVGNRLVIVAMAFLSAGLTGIMVLISDFLYGGAAAWVAGVLAAGLVVGVWFVVPLIRRRKTGPPDTFGG
jgi:O-antigen/teichoic acid export membrane protein